MTTSPALPAKLNGLAIEWVKLDELKIDPRHAHVHNRSQGRKLTALVGRFGIVRPVLVDEHRTIIDGVALVEVLRAMGQEYVPIIIVANRTPEEVRALRLALNRSAEDAGWDRQKLGTEFRELIELGFDMTLTGFDAVEIDMVLEIDAPHANMVEEEEAEDLEPRPASAVRQGDTIICGQHIVACADATGSAVWTTLLQGRNASVVFTDPPYNVKISNNVSGLGVTKHREFAMASGEMTREAFTAFLYSFIAALLPALADGAILFTCMDWRHLRELTDAAEANGLELKNLVVWCKTNAGMGSFYRSQHELVFVFKYGDGPHQNNFGLGQHGRSRSNVWRYAGVNTFGKGRKEQLEAHPTCKPVIMVADALRDVSRRGDIVLDPFLGSGSTLLAAEETGRVCVGVEIDPAYVEVAIRRWQKRTKLDAVHATSGETFDEFCARRTAEAKSTDTTRPLIAAPSNTTPQDGTDHEQGL